MTAINEPDRNAPSTSEGVPKPSDHEDRTTTATAVDLVTYIEKELRESGIEVVDASIYPSTYDSEKYEIVTIVGYVPGLACCFTIKISLSRYGGSKFMIDGELRDATPESTVRPEHRWFPRCERMPDQCERFNSETIYLNTYVRSGSNYCPDATSQLDRGLNFYRTFIREYGAVLAEKFSRENEKELDFVPHFSDELIALERENGKGNPLNRSFFNSRVLSKFPQGFFTSHPLS